MATISKGQLHRLKILYYDQGLSAQEAADRLNVPLDAVFYCMRKNGLKRRKRQESNHLRFQRADPSFRLCQVLDQKTELLKAIGTMLYWGEGCKSNRTTVVDFANSDPEMIKLFLHFLRKVCGVREDKLRVFPYFYANQDIERNIDYWIKTTGIGRNQFTKPYIRKDFKPEKSNRMPYGLIHIRYADKKLLSLIKGWIEHYQKYFG